MFATQNFKLAIEASYSDQGVTIVSTVAGRYRSDGTFKNGHKV